MHGLKKSTLHVSLSTFMLFPVWFILGFTRGFATAMPCTFSQCKKIASPALFVSLLCQYLMQSAVCFACSAVTYDHVDMQPLLRSV